MPPWGATDQRTRSADSFATGSWTERGSRRRVQPLPGSVASHLRGYAHTGSACTIDGGDRAIHGRPESTLPDSWPTCTVRPVSGTIVVGYDDGDAAQRALARAIEEARGSHRRLVIVSVLEMPLNPEGPQNFGTLDDSPARMIPLVQPPELEPTIARARAQVEAAALRADYVWAVGDPADSIIGAAKNHRAGLIVLGSHHHGFFTRLLGTDVAAGVKREADCDVLVVE